MNRLTIPLFSAACAALFFSTSGQAVPVATITGQYDTAEYDTPDLVFYNTSAYDLTGAQMVLHGYQGLNNGLTQTVALPNITAGTNYTYVWNGPTTPGNLTAYDYDDEWGNTTPYNPACVVGQSLCSYVGNFSVTFTAMWDGKPVYSQFSPSNNYTKGFVGWEGLDPNGLSETTYDAHSGTPQGTLALINIGIPHSPVPEPSEYALTMAGLGLMGFIAYRRKRDSSDMSMAA